MKIKIFVVALFLAFSPLYSQQAKSDAEFDDFREMYQEKYLEPGFLGGFINWGYWPSKIDYMDDNARIEASKNLYRETFSSIGISSSDEVLEIGCGKGKGAQLLADEIGSKKIFAIDQNERFIDLAKKNANKNVNYLVGNANNFKFKNKFDKIYCVEASQHFSQFRNFIFHVSKNLRSEGKFSLIGFFAPTEDGVSYLKEQISTVKSGVDIVRSLPEVISLLQEAGFKDIKVKSIGDRVISQYEQWIEQVSYENVWAKNWKTAYEKNKVDYYIISATKPTFFEIVHAKFQEMGFGFNHS